MEARFLLQGLWWFKILLSNKLVLLLFQQRPIICCKGNPGLWFFACILEEMKSRPVAFCMYS